jgi:hypothetical protein
MSLDNSNPAILHFSFTGFQEFIISFVSDFNEINNTLDPYRRWVAMIFFKINIQGYKTLIANKR